MKTITYEAYDRGIRDIVRQTLNTHGTSLAECTLGGAPYSTQVIEELRPVEKLIIVKDNWRKILRAMNEEHIKKSN